MVRVAQSLRLHCCWQDPTHHNVCGCQGAPSCLETLVKRRDGPLSKACSHKPLVLWTKCSALHPSTASAPRRREEIGAAIEAVNQPLPFLLWSGGHSRWRFRGATCAFYNSIMCAMQIFVTRAAARTTALRTVLVLNACPSFEAHRGRRRRASQFDGLLK